MTLRTSIPLRILLLVSLVIGTIGCSSEATDTSVAGDAQAALTRAEADLAKIAAQAGKGKPKKGTHPCDAFTLADVTSLFGIAAESVKNERGAVPGNFTCEYEWKKADWEEIKERNDAGYLKVVTGKAGPGGLQKYLATMVPEDAKVFITFHGGDFKNEAHAIHSLDLLIEGFKKGMGTKDFMVQAEFDPSEGVATKAAWSDKLRQLSSVSGTTLYHVKVERNAERSLDRVDAEEIARRIHAAL